MLQNKLRKGIVHLVMLKFAFKSRKMRMISPILILSLLSGFSFGTGCASSDGEGPDHSGEHGASDPSDQLAHSEVHLTNIHQFTFGGDNAEAYWSFSGDQLVFQANNPAWGLGCDQIFVMGVDSDGTPTPEHPAMVSTGQGRTTCSYFMPGDSTVVYASTHLADTVCPPVPPRGPNGEYVWPIYEGYDIFVADLGGNILGQITDQPGYDAEATLSPTGDRMVFTSTRSGDLELFTCDLEGGDVVQITSDLGYDGGAFFSPDGEWLVWRASRPETDEEQAHYRGLLEKGLVEPSEMELFVSRIDGSDMRQVTDLGGANWAPFFHPNGESILFCTNHHTGGFPFNIFRVQLDGSGLEQITFDQAFDSFPMFSPDGKKLAFSSNRNNGRTRNTNVFVADWVE